MKKAKKYLVLAVSIICGMLSALTPEDIQQAKEILLAVDYYKILGVARDASEREIKKAYRKLSLKFHPDKVARESDEIKLLGESAIKKIIEAKETLSDQRKRNIYDQYSGVDFKSLSPDEQKKYFATYERSFKNFLKKIAQLPIGAAITDEMRAEVEELRQALTLLTPIQPEYMVHLDLLRTFMGEVSKEFYKPIYEGVVNIINYVLVIPYYEPL